MGGVKRERKKLLQGVSIEASFFKKKILEKISTKNLYKILYKIILDFSFDTPFPFKLNIKLNVTRLCKILIMSCTILITMKYFHNFQAADAVIQLFRIESSESVVGVRNNWIEIS